MAQVENAVNLHEATVTAIPRLPRTTPRPRAAARSGPVSSRLVVDPRVWAEALRLAGGDRSRLEVRAREGAVIVRNP